MDRSNLESDGRSAVLEMELKFRVDDLSGVAERLRGLGIEPGEPAEEKNLLLDLHGGPLRKTDTLFRLRSIGNGVLLTVKKPIPSTCLKVRLERETMLSCSLEEALELFSLLGYGVVCTYEKKRRECRLGDAAVCLDELWFGSFVEIEAASEDAVMEAAERLGFDPGEGIRFSYAHLQRDAEEELRREGPRT
jgi:adenylate cyclase, class 2